MVKQDCSNKLISKLANQVLNFSDENLFGYYIQKKDFNKARMITEKYRENNPKSRRAEMLDSLVTELCVNEF